MKKGDIIIIISLLAAALVGAVCLFTFSGKGSRVMVKQDNETVYQGSVHQDKVVMLEGNTVVIEDGKVYVRQADCKNQVCVKHQKISKKGESIICLPNRVIAEIK